MILGAAASRRMTPSVPRVTTRVPRRLYDVHLPIHASITCIQYDLS